MLWVGVWDDSNNYITIQRHSIFKVPTAGFDPPFVQSMNLLNEKHDE